MSAPHLSIAILTFRRPDQLRQVLDALAPRIVEAVPAVEVRVLVVDNDPGASASDVAREPRPYPVDYVVEPTPGIAAARFRALDEARASRLLVFIDDDELPDPHWLRALVDTWAATGAHAVAGRLISELPADVDPWVLWGGFFERAAIPTGTRLDAAASYNLLLDLDFVRTAGLQFDRTLGLSGGEDTLFTRQLTQAGGVLVACAESIARDHVVPERLTRAWLRRRAFAQGTVLADVRLRLAPAARRPLTRVRGVAGGLARIGKGGVSALAGVLFRSPRRRVRGQRDVLRGAGMTMRSLGYRHSTYRR